VGRRDGRAEDFVTYASSRRRYLRRAAYLMCGDWHLADDLVQTALIKLYVAWPRIRTDGAQDAYARRIIVRAYLDERRRPWRRERIGLDGDDRAAPDRISTEDGDALLTALKTLPDRQRTTIVLRFWCGLSVDEVAGEMGCSVGTVKSQTARAMVGLRNILSADEASAERGPQ
jgi:RNA polymerase sigma-70 factor (sigma-E family)